MRREEGVQPQRPVGAAHEQNARKLNFAEGFEVKVIAVGHVVDCIQILPAPLTTGEGDERDRQE